MVRQKIYLPEWGWRVFVYYAVDRCYADEILALMEEMGATRVTLSKAERNLRSGALNSGLTYSDNASLSSVMVIGLTDSPEQFADTLDHEKGHLARHICQAHAVDPYGEEAQYIAGAIGRKLFPVAKRFLCEHCRTAIEKEFQGKGD